MLADQLNALGMQTDKVGTILAALFSLTMIDAKKIRISAVAAFSQRNTDLGNREIAGTANREQVLADSIMAAAFQ
jgi:hypothetical protein